MGIHPHEVGIRGYPHLVGSTGTLAGVAAQQHANASTIILPTPPRQVPQRGMLGFWGL